MSESITITANSIDNPETDVRRNERFHLVPRKRLEALVTTSGLIGAMIGFYDGVKISSLRYLTENAHRMPKTVGGWYFIIKEELCHDRCWCQKGDYN